MTTFFEQFGGILRLPFDALLQRNRPDKAARHD
jgi:hypothetical protein